MDHLKKKCMSFVEHGSTLSKILKLLETPLSPIVLTHCAQMLDQMQFELSTARREKCTLPTCTRV